MPRTKKVPEEKEAEPTETEVAKVENVEDLEGVGAVTAQKLEDAGYNTIEMLACAIVEQLKALDIEDKQARKIISAARAQVHRFGLEFKTADQVLKEHEARWKLSTHVKSLDEVLGGGFESTTVNTIHGAYGCGKSQTSHWATACMLADDKGAQVLFVDTENSFRPERVLNFLNILGGSKEDLARVIHSEAINSSFQRLIIEHAGKKIKENNVKLLIVDSATSHFRSEYPGRDQLSPRQQTLNAHLQVISKLTRMFGLVTILTNQEIAVPVVGYGGGATSKPVAGNIFGHRGFMNLQIWRPDNPMSEVRIITVEKHPSLPPRRVEVSLTEQGFSEAKEKK
ncbi:MAG: repair and recombination protein RadA protein [Candidatus Woesebacteria bacterium GW2011_GWB1_39_12]|uniref:Repair and recombination protein RadA protein n=1 Tax=Candidatus Woesebacteria bacterium GW2011_GWB1_39_12 TaxID=1618574 RepID=A0A0G0QIX6_9BACT|nr:MAG: repair and recombination protein RadA protein [Candidatus Woesebacteria bacterium GW2011_GWB1_39_12]